MIPALLLASALISIDILLEIIAERVENGRIKRRLWNEYESNQSQGKN